MTEETLARTLTGAVEKDLAAPLRAPGQPPQQSPQTQPPKPVSLADRIAKQPALNVEQLLTMARAGHDDCHVRLRAVRREYELAKLKLIQEAREEIDRIEQRTKGQIVRITEEYDETTALLERQIATYSRVIGD